MDYEQRRAMLETTFSTEESLTALLERADASGIAPVPIYGTGENTIYYSGRKLIMQTATADIDAPATPKALQQLLLTYHDWLPTIDDASTVLKKGLRDAVEK